MSETEADRQYYAAAEAAFIRRRGTPFLLSPKDFALLKEWRALGVPVEAVEQGIDDAFGRREERQATGRVNSLSYCRDAVLSAWERRAQAAVGRGGGRESTPIDARRALEELTTMLEDVSRSRPDLAGPLESARHSLARLGQARRGAEEIESSLARLDKRLAGVLLDALAPAERQELDAEVQRLLARAKVRMDEPTTEKTARALARRLLREKLGLPRLTLL